MMRDDHLSGYVRCLDVYFTASRKVWEHRASSAEGPSLAFGFAFQLVTPCRLDMNLILSLLHFHSRGEAGER